MTKPQIELAVKKSLDELREKSPIKAVDAPSVNSGLELGAEVAIARIVLELAREGYSFQKNQNWKPL